MLSGKCLPGKAVSVLCRPSHASLEAQLVGSTQGPGFTEKPPFSCSISYGPGHEQGPPRAAPHHLLTCCCSSHSGMPPSPGVLDGTGAVADRGWGAVFGRDPASHTITHNHTQSHKITHNYTQSHTITHNHTQSHKITHARQSRRLVRLPMMKGLPRSKATGQSLAGRARAAHIHAHVHTRVARAAYILCGPCGTHPCTCTHTCA